MDTETAFLSESADDFLNGDAGHPVTPEGMESFARETAERIRETLEYAIRERFNHSQLREWSADDIPHW